MNFLEKAKTVAHIVKWRLNWEKYDLEYLPKKQSSKFITAGEASRLIKDRDTVISTGMAGSGRCSIFYWAIRDRYKEEAKPKNLQWVTVSAQGGRGRAPGTVEELAIPGLVTEYITGHIETARAFLEIAEEGHVELHTMPQGEMTRLLKAQAEGKNTIKSSIGVGTFLDPRTGTGSATTPNAKNSYISANGDENSLDYHLPDIDVAAISAPYADSEGNIYFKHAATVTENTEAAYAAHANGGIVMVAVCDIIEKDEKNISLPAEVVDYVVVNPWNEQSAGVKQRKYFELFAAGAKVDVEKAIAKLKYINKLMGITPYRGPVENTLCRMTTSVFTECARKGDLVNLGIGLPEEVGRLLYESGLYKDLIFSSETGAYGGLPTPGIYFGSAVNPEKLMGSYWMFNHYKENLEVGVLGILQVDSEGNVNVSNRGEAVSDYVGPGGFLNIASSARTIIFVGSWMAKADMEIKDNKLVINKPGIAKFVSRVDEVTFSGRQALKQGKNVFYVTNVGIFKLTERGVEMTQVMPGVDLEKDIINGCGAEIMLPENGEVPVVPESVITGKGLDLSLEERK